MIMRESLLKLYFFFLIFAPFLLLALPSSFFDNGESICLSVMLFDVECYACGLTRAIQHLIHLELSIAYEFNKLSFLVFPLLVVFLYQELKRVYSLLR